MIPSTILLVVGLLLLFSLGYNWLIARIADAVPDHGYTAITILAAFAVSGSAMTVGSIQRHLARRKRDLDRQRSELSDVH